MIGKVPASLLDEHVFARSGAADDRVIQGPAYGEDTAAVQLGEEIVVVNTDPLSLATERIGTLGVHVACNDVAASGATPAWMTNAIFLHEPDAERLRDLTTQLDTAARALDIAIIGGHSEYAPNRSRPLLVATCFGLADRYVPTAGATPGDRLLLTKSAGLEGAAILATDFEARLRDAVPPSVVTTAASWFDRISVFPEAAHLTPIANAMHDPTEGGLLNGLLEMALASETHIDVDRSAIPVREETKRICAAVGVDPLRIFASGALVAAIPPDHLEEALDRLTAAEIPHALIGRVRDGAPPGVDLDGQRFTEPIRDEMYDLWAD